MSDTPSSSTAGPARIMRVKFTEQPALEDYRVTVQHPNGKRVDVAEKDLGVDGRVIEVRNLHRYAALYGEGDLPGGITVSVTPVDDTTE